MHSDVTVIGGGDNETSICRIAEANEGGEIGCCCHILASIGLNDGRQRDAKRVTYV